MSPSFPAHEWLLAQASGGQARSGTTSAHPSTAADWEAVLRIAGRFGILPLLHQRCLDNQVRLPETVREELRNAYLVNTAKNALLYRDLGAILKVFRESGLDVIVLKGAHLAALAYESPSLRTMVDIDLLLRPEDLGRAGDLLKTLGYRSLAPGADLQAWCQLAKHLPGFVKPHSPAIELHWTIAEPGSPYQIDLDKLWERSRNVTIAGEHARVLSPEDLLIHLCIHTAGHSCRSHNFIRAPFAQGTRPLVDISTAIHADRAILDWDRLASIARKAGADKTVFIGLHLVRELLGAQVPRSALGALRPPDFDDARSRLAFEQVALIGSESPIPESLRGTYSRWIDIYHEMGLDKGGSRWQMLRRLIIPNRSYMVGYMGCRHPDVKMPSRTTWAHLIRVRDILRTTLRLLWHLARHSRDAREFAKLGRTQHVFWTWLTRAPARRDESSLTRKAIP